MSFSLETLVFVLDEDAYVEEALSSLHISYFPAVVTSRSNSSSEVKFNYHTRLKGSSCMIVKMRYN